MTRSILIGKGRRVTLVEVDLLAQGDGVLELYAAENEQLPPPIDSLSTTIASLSVTADDEGSLSPSASLTALTLLALTVSNRLIQRDSDALMVTSALVELTNLAKETKSRLPKEPASFLASLITLLPGHVKLLQEISLEHVQQIISLAVGCLAAVRGLSLARAATPVSALSAERVKINTSAYADVHFDVNRPHRGLVTCAASLRAILQGSKYANPQSKSTDNVSVSTIPQYHGPALEALKASCKTLELEFNCATTGVDDTVAVLALKQSLDAITTLLDGCKARMSKPGGFVAPNGDTSSASCLLESAVAQLETSLLEEGKMGSTFVKNETTRAAQDAKEKEAAKAARAAAMANPNAEKKDEFEGMTKQQKEKILKKRAEKEAKVAAKRAAKQQTVSLFGAGTVPIANAMETAGTSLSENTVQELEDIVSKLLSGGQQRKPKIPKGTRDYLPEQMMIRQQAFGIIRRVFQSHGAVEIDTPVFELKDTLTGKYGEDSKLIYDLADQGGELLALRYDLTVPFARFLALNSVGNIKRYHIGKVYRRDQPQLSRGRYREFYQCDFDIAGNYGRMVPDAECVCVACEILDSLPIGDFGIKLNHRCLLDAILDICGVPAEKFRSICSAVDKLDKEPWEEVKREMVEDKGLESAVADKIGTFVLEKGEPFAMYNQLMESKRFGDHKGALTAMEDLRIIFEYLEAMDKLKFVTFDLSLARGLDYYTGVIYEAVCMSGNTQVGSIGGGGRYDNLVSMFQEAGKVTPCVGVSVGIERVFTLMENRYVKLTCTMSRTLPRTLLLTFPCRRFNRLREEQGGSIKQPNVDVLVATVGDGMMKERMKLTQLLWDANISAEFSQQDSPKLKYEIPNALDRGIPFMAIVGEDEAKERTCKLKDLKARTEETVPMAELVSTLRKKGVVPVGCELAAELLAEERKSN
jgi:histidyl-tRNA synthetase